jgi:hypothetical protein
LNIFGHKKGDKVPLKIDVLMKCNCGICPVQTDSPCAKPKIISLIEFKKKMTSEIISNLTKEQTTAKLTNPKKLPGPYCATGSTDCKDFEFTKMCHCMSCQVFKEFKLMNGKPIGYFCRDGKAK